jgi:hypothetical protein
VLSLCHSQRFVPNSLQKSNQGGSKELCRTQGSHDGESTMTLLVDHNLRELVRKSKCGFGSRCIRAVARSRAIGELKSEMLSFNEEEGCVSQVSNIIWSIGIVRG